MRRYNTLNGKDLLEKLLIISNQEGKLSYDGTTLLPCNKEYSITAKAVCAMMKAYGIEPKLEDYNGLDLHENYMRCFIGNVFSEKRHKQAMTLLSRYIGDDAEITQLKKSSLCTRESRYELFMYFFMYRKKLIDLENIYAKKEVLRSTRGFLLSKLITEYSYCKRIDSLNRYYDKLLFLLMGDYADMNLDEETLITEYGYPGFPRKK